MQSLKHVIASQSSDWRGNPVDFSPVYEIATPVCTLVRDDVENIAAQIDDHFA